MRETFLVQKNCCVQRSYSSFDCLLCEDIHHYICIYRHYTLCWIYVLWFGKIFFPFSIGYIHTCNLVFSWCHKTSPLRKEVQIVWGYIKKSNTTTCYSSSPIFGSLLKLDRCGSRDKVAYLRSLLHGTCTYYCK